MRRFVVLLAWLSVSVALFAACGGLIASVPDDGGIDGAVGDGSSGDGGACSQFDLQTDPLHCGSCTTICASGQLCSAGKCKASCDAPTTKCTVDGGPLCVTLGTDPKNCGQCNHACDPPDAGSLAQGTGNDDSGLPPPLGYDAGTGWVLGTSTCANGACGVACSKGTTHCGGGVCFDTQNHHDHCGSCGTACAAGEWCTSGHCCAPGQLSCNGACTDVASDAANCGMCGTICSGGTPYCVDGTCAAGCTPSGTRQPFNAVVSSTTSGCWNTGNPCVQDTAVFSQTNGKNFQANGQELVCGGTTACVGHVGIGTYSSAAACQGTWDVYCNATKVGTINTVNKACMGTAMTNGCNVAFTPAPCSTLHLVATGGSGTLSCCAGNAPDSMIIAVSAW
ncbi:MAG TPA: hypothetical protein VF316_05135 [Polyangiaceae bacterium]